MIFGGDKGNNIWDNVSSLFLYVVLILFNLTTQAEQKLSRAERALSKVEESLKPAERTRDPESITDEERFMFRKLGLRMKAFLLLGNYKLSSIYRLLMIFFKAKWFSETAWTWQNFVLFSVNDIFLGIPTLLIDAVLVLCS